MAETPVAPLADRFAVLFRRHRRDPWRVIVTCGTHAQAEALMLDLAIGQGGGSGDWRVGRAPESPR